MLAVRGAGSQIVAALRDVVAVPRDGEMPLDANRYLFCAGVLRPKKRHEQTDAEVEEGYRVNLWQVTDDCERILSANPKARICVIGSESGFVGSYDDVYADAKYRLHRYVECKRLKPGQQLVCIAPGVIEDCGMAVTRADPWRLDRRREAHPQKRFLKAAEVARLVQFVLYEDRSYLNNVVIRMNGGEHTGSIDAGS